MKDSVLIGVFIHRKTFPYKALKDIIETTSAKKIFVFNAGENIFLLTFNLDNDLISDRFKTLQNKYGGAIRFHRKRHNNVLYTINAIKEFEKKENSNQSEMKDCCIVLDKNKNVSIFNLKLIMIFKEK